MPLRENHINPCFCVSLLAGTIALSIYDVVREMQLLLSLKIQKLYSCLYYYLNYLYFLSTPKIYGIAYIFRVMYIEYLQKAYHDYFPAEIPNPTKSDFMSAMFRRGNYILTIICGVLILFATTYLVHNQAYISVFENKTSNL